MSSRNAARRERAVQTGFVMRAYRESFLREDGRRGLTQEELLRHMGEVDVEYSERFSHATVSKPKPRWDVHMAGDGDLDWGYAGTPLPLIAGWSGSGA